MPVLGDLHIAASAVDEEVEAARRHAMRLLGIPEPTELVEDDTRDETIRENDTTTQDSPLDGAPVEASEPMQAWFGVYVQAEMAARAALGDDSDGSEDWARMSLPVAGGSIFDDMVTEAGLRAGTGKGLAGLLADSDLDEHLWGAGEPSADLPVDEQEPVLVADDFPEVAPVEEPPVEEPPVEVAPVEEPPVEEPPVEAEDVAEPMDEDAAPTPTPEATAVPEVPEVPEVFAAPLMVETPTDLSDMNAYFGHLPEMPKVEGITTP